WMPSASTLVDVDTEHVNANPIGAAGLGLAPSLLWQRAAAVRYGLGWQWTAVKMQYERLMARNMSAPGDLVVEALRDYMRGVIDMDFFVTAVRRFLRVAD